MKTDTVVVFILIRDKDVLVEKRPLNSHFPGEYLFPGGKVKKHELDNIEKALERELKEELGVEALDFKELITNAPIYGWDGVLIKPFIVYRWSGDLPEKILDIGNPIEWMHLDKLLFSPVEPVKKIVKALIHNRS